jgi:hypothetical protein
VKILTGVLAAAAIACAQPSFGWSATVRPPHPSLPAIDVTFGYPGGYAPENGSPVILRARTPFDGMIGYHFEVAGNKTVDPSFATRGTSLRNVVRSEYDPRIPRRRHRLRHELIVEWRDASGKLLATGNAGKPPWTEGTRAACVTGTPPPSDRYLGQSAVILDAAQLPAWPQWYAGLSALIVPAELWLSLDPDVRKAVFHSGTRLMLFGLPGPRAIVLPTDDAILPVTFGANGVRPKPGAARLDGPDGPRLVQGPKAVWAESEEHFREPLPQMAASHLRSFTWSEASGGSYRTVLGALADFRAMLFLGIAAVLVPLIWWLARRGMVAMAASLALAVVIAHPLYRNVMRPRTLERAEESLRLIAPGIHLHERRDEIYGDVPLRAPLREREWQESAIHTILDIQPEPEYAELSALGTPLQLAHRTPSAAWRQLSRRTELADPANVTVERLADDALTLGYDLPHAPHRIIAGWSRAGRYFFGSVDVSEARRGRVTIPHGRLSRSMDANYLWSPFRPRHGNTELVSVSFHAKDRGTTHIYDWHGDVPARYFVPYRIVAPVRRIAGGTHIAELVIPEGGVPPDGSIELTGAQTSRDILPGATLEGNGVRVAVQRRDRTKPYRVSIADFRRVAKEHGLVNIHLPAAMDERYFAAAQVVVAVRGTPK